MAKSLPSRPNLDHLRRQAKTLLAALADGDAEAVRTFREHLPAAKGMSAQRVRSAGFRLADAQSALARANGFAAWPQLARHVDTLRALEGTWTFASLVVDGESLPGAALTSSRILIDGDRFRTESPEATYEGVFNLDVDADPHAIDIEFAAGPEAGQTNRGIFALRGERLEICLDVRGGARPVAFRSARGSGHAHEVLERTSMSRPANVTGGKRPARERADAREAADAVDPAAFAATDTPLLAELQGEWSAVRVVRDGQELPAAMLKTGRRVARANDVRVSFGGQVMIHALVRFDTSLKPVAIDYLLQAGAAKGRVQHGIFEWRDGTACFCMAAPGDPRPADFASAPGSGRTFSQWKLAR